ncbi:MAG: thiamine pyrophosphate-binding protein, partial [Acidobacteria bacterium]|nr:thiamine pyrophosphate-binding protein [Acidobacteriota bacterium]
PDYRVEDFARTTGCRYFRILRDTEVDSVLDIALNVTREGIPVMLEVVIDYSRPTWFTRGVLKTNFWRLPWYDRLRMLLRAVGRRLV